MIAIDGLQCTAAGHHMVRISTLVDVMLELLRNSL